MGFLRSQKNRKWKIHVNPGFINPVYGCLIGRVPFTASIISEMTIGGVPPPG
jgi:hypothetical protein